MITPNQGPVARMAAVSIAAEVTVWIRGGKLRLDRKGRATVRLSCPAAEVSGPCRERLVVKTQRKLLFKGKRRVVALASSKFRVPAGRTRPVKLRLGGPQAQLVRKNREARAVRVTAIVRDQAGNRARVTKKLKLVPTQGKRRG